jgi:hypothetical protein
MGSVVFALILLTSGLLRVAAMFVKGKLFFRDTLTIVVWSCVPLLALLPIGVALYQMMSADAMSFWIPLVTALAFGWTLLRTLRATAVVFDVPPLLVYGVGLGGLVLTAVVLGVIWSVRYSTMDFLQYYQNVMAV